jgi:hypothetical protein
MQDWDLFQEREAERLLQGEFRPKIIRSQILQKEDGKGAFSKQDNFKRWRHVAAGVWLGCRRCSAATASAAPTTTAIPVAAATDSAMPPADLFQRSTTMILMM